MATELVPGLATVLVPELAKKKKIYDLKTKHKTSRKNNDMFTIGVGTGVGTGVGFGVGGAGVGAGVGYE